MLNRRSTFLFFLITGVLACWAAVFHDTFGYDWHWDDYHMIRAYSTAELASTLAGPWDIDGLETPSYRPGLALFHHLRGRLIGDSVRSQRVFEMILMGAFLFILGSLLSKLGLDRPTLACLYCVLAASKVFTIHLLFLADGCQILSGLFLASSALALLGYIDSRNICFKAGAILSAAAALSIKEDAYTAAPLAAAVCGFYLWKSAPRKPRGAFAYLRLLGPVWDAVLVIALLTCAHYALRALLVPGAPALSPVLTACWEYFEQIRISVFNFGILSYPNYSEAEAGFQTSSWVAMHLVSAHALILGSVAGMFAFESRSSARFVVSLMSVCGLVLCLPGLSVCRLDLVLMPTIFFLAAFAVALREAWRSAFHGEWSLNPRSAFVVSVSLGYGVVAAGGLQRTIQEAEDFHPLSINKVLMDVEDAFGLRSAAPVPNERRQRLLQRLQTLDIRSYQDGRTLAQDVSKNWPAYVANREAKSSIFIPHFFFIAP